MWCNTTEGAKFWLSVLTELKNRGLQDMLICCCDGLTSFPAAIEAVYPNAKIQFCIVHLIRQSLRFVGWKDRKAVAADLKKIYGSALPWRKQKWRLQSLQIDGMRSFQ